MKGAAFLLIAGLLLGVGALVASQRAGSVFSHLAHERLFPVCEGCHAGVLNGGVERLYPDPLVCAQCHDGTRAKRVEWHPPAPRASNLRFFHPDHVEVLAITGEAISCQTCHAARGPASRMNVAAAEPVLCLQCHAHAAETHLAAAVDCNLCHVPLSEAVALPLERVARFPRPPSHDAGDFLSRHAPDGRSGQISCGVCHARQTCERCHVNAERLPQVAALAPDPRVAVLEAGKPPAYPLPRSHLDREWELAHGAAARAEPLGCSNCHTQPSCGGCHLEASGRTAAVIASLPNPGPGRAAGVSLSQAAATVHPPDFAGQHASWAASGSLQCAQCHTRNYCSECHAGTDSRAFHPANFVERHAAEVFGAAADCQSCHSTETFCQSCHRAAGLASQGRMNAAFHTGQPLWVLSHGQAARMGMESCASCHRQTDCMQCHSAAGGWGVNPHGPGFNAGRMGARNPAACRACHLNDPTGRE